MTDARLVLASASPRRRELLRELGVPFDMTSVDIDEAAIARSFAGPPDELALRLAAAKLDACRDAGGLVLLTADTIVAVDGRILGKPADAREATSMLRDLRGRDHTVVTAIAIGRGGETRLDSSIARVTMRRYTDDEVDAYVARGEPFDKAGAYAIQDPQLAPAAAWEGCYCAIVGLPLWRTHQLLRRTGLDPSDPALPPCVGCPDAAPGTLPGSAARPYPGT